MGASRFTCTLAPAACSSYARVTLADTQGETARACPRHAVAALNGITGARVIWADTRGVTSTSAPPCTSPKNASSSAGRPRVAVCEARSGVVACRQSAAPI
jgi:hypothetical protein